VLLVVNPSALVLDGFLLGALGGVGVVSLTVAFLKAKHTFSVTIQVDLMHGKTMLDGSKSENRNGLTPSRNSPV